MTCDGGVRLRDGGFRSCDSRSAASPAASFSTSFHTLASCACAYSDHQVDRHARNRDCCRSPASAPTGALHVSAAPFGQVLSSCHRTHEDLALGAVPGGFPTRSHAAPRRAPASETMGGLVYTLPLHSDSQERLCSAVKCSPLSAETLPRTLYRVTAKASTPTPPLRSTPPTAPPTAASFRDAGATVAAATAAPGAVLAAKGAADKAEVGVGVEQGDARCWAPAAARRSLARPHTAAAAAASGEPTANCAAEEFGGHVPGEWGRRRSCGCCGVDRTASICSDALVRLARSLLTCSSVCTSC